MEGLIPMIFKKMKRNTIRRNYQCLSQSPRYDFYANSSDVPLPPPSRSILDNSNESPAFYDGRHRRRSSMPEEFMKADKGVAELELVDSCPPPMGSKQFVQFRSQRMFG